MNFKEHDYINLIGLDWKLAERVVSKVKSLSGCYRWSNESCMKFVARSKYHLVILNDTITFLDEIDLEYLKDSCTINEIKYEDILQLRFAN